jgi:hypothetical protein
MVQRGPARGDAMSRYVSLDLVVKECAMSAEMLSIFLNFHRHECDIEAAVRAAFESVIKNLTNNALPAPPEETP